MIIQIQNKEIEMKKILNDMKKWITDNYEGINKNKYLRKIDETLGLFKDNYLFESKGRSRITADITENMLKRNGGNLIYSNHYQNCMIQQSRKNYSNKSPAIIPHMIPHFGKK